MKLNYNLQTVRARFGQALFSFLWKSFSFFVEFELSFA